MSRLTKLGIALTVLLAVTWVGSMFVVIKLAQNTALCLGSLRVLTTTGMPPIQGRVEFLLPRMETVWLPTRATTRHFTVTYFPLWLALAAAALPTAFMVVRDKRRRVAINYCRKCGYDLTGNVSGVCPECGTEV